MGSKVGAMEVESWSRGCGVGDGKTVGHEGGEHAQARESWRRQGAERSRCGHRLVTIELLDAPAVVIGQHEVLCVHPLVKGCHDGRGIVGMLKAQGMAQLMHSHQKDVIPWKDRAGYDGSLGPSPQTHCFPIRSFTVKPACQIFHPK